VSPQPSSSQASTVMSSMLHSRATLLPPKSTCGVNAGLPMEPALSFLSALRLHSLFLVRFVLVQSSPVVKSIYLCPPRRPSPLPSKQGPLFDRPHTLTCYSFFSPGAAAAKTSTSWLALARLTRGGFSPLSAVPLIDTARFHSARTTLLYSKWNSELHGVDSVLLPVIVQCACDPYLQVNILLSRKKIAQVRPIKEKNARVAFLVEAVDDVFLLLAPARQRGLQSILSGEVPEKTFEPVCRAARKGNGDLGNR
jgi:hypothetical protein